MRQLQYHEKKLLKKVNFYSYKGERNARVIEIMKRYHIQRREDYTKYNHLCGLVRKIVHKLSVLKPADAYRVEKTEWLLRRMFEMGLVKTEQSLAACDQLSASTFCRRRLPVVMVRLKMAETVKKATEFIEQGHVRVGPQRVTDPAFLVTRTMEDFVTWVDTSKIKRHVMKYNDKLDDFDLL